jgi:hypothetical protein
MPRYVVRAPQAVGTAILTLAAPLTTIRRQKTTHNEGNIALRNQDADLR